MTDHSDNKSKDHFPDLIRLVRSIQHIEGNPECFARADVNCDREDCPWREYCLEQN
ncbi:MAG: hypothetical protein JRE65_04640 [Deltaproteobacteria bacterium]|jgi:hypothetical protein|nr:hypothetical protein [Deltaproteobacteria bacterium]